MGKTSLALKYVHSCPHDRIFIFDHQSEFAMRLGIPTSRTAVDGESFLKLAQTERVVPFDFTVHFGGHKEEAFAWFCGLVMDTAREALEPQGKEALFICDELQQFVNSAQSPIEFKEIMETGRRYNLDTFTLSRAPNRVNVATREEFTELFLFRLDDENSLKFAEAIGADTEAVQHLQPHEYLYFNVISGRETKDRLEFVRKGTTEKTLDKGVPA